MDTELLKLITTKRPTISKTSLKTYESILRNLYKKVFPKDEKMDLDKFDNDNGFFIEHLMNVPANKRKTILSALVVITDNKNYRDLMMDDIKEYNKEQAKQEKPNDDKWIEKDDLKKLYKTLTHNAKLLYKKEELTPTDFQDIQNYIIMSLLGGVYIPPRRSKDYVCVKIKNVDKEKDNYIDKNEFVFNNYKTAKTYGQQRLEIPKELRTIINKWIKINPTDYLLFDIGLNPLSNVKLNQRLNKLFGKKVGINELRKHYLSSKYANLIDVKKDLAKDFKDMGSSLIQENIYIKK